ncbi:hypothetical protein CCACVL1_30043 [Corchorus capsularis]|uniref:Uncharacterized protein n=1 Tax=Corchorus capsularis TaxID=210143 RepID=A0A1R3FYZ3_COCAP|nr:hypothetical protein CCACVL1_30043 [Corchorus capsularis]
MEKGNQREIDGKRANRRKESHSSMPMWTNEMGTRKCKANDYLTATNGHEITTLEDSNPVFRMNF